MVDQLPQYYFRIRENGALVFRVDTQNRQHRLEMDQIASINVNKGEHKPQGDVELDAADEAAIKEWIANRQAVLARRGRERIQTTVEHLNLTTQWAVSKASDAELEEITEELLLAMHDLRRVLVRKKTKRGE